jgi:hypothetical protein
MSLVLTSTGAATRESLLLLETRPGTVLELLVVAVDGEQCAGVDLASGTLVRAWSPAPVDRGLRPYDVVEATLTRDFDRLPDPSEPEGVVLDAPPERIGRLKGRRAERLLRPLLHPRNEPLLGFHAPAVAFWERRADRPSITLVDPEGPVVLERGDGYLGCRLYWRGRLHELPCLDRRMAAAMDRAGRRQAQLRRGDRLVIALTPPIDGHCHKVVESILPRH